MVPYPCPGPAAAFPSWAGRPRCGAPRVGPGPLVLGRPQPAPPATPAVAARPATPLPPWYRSQGVLGLGVLAGAGPRQPGPPPGRERRLRGPAGRTRRPSCPYCPQPAAPSCSSTIPRTSSAWDSPSAGWPWPFGGGGHWPAALFGAAVLTKQFAVLLRPALAVAEAACTYRPRRLVCPRVRCRHPPLPVRLPSGDPGEPQRVQCRGRGRRRHRADPAGRDRHGGLAVARDAPVLFAVGVCLWAAGRPDRRTDRPVALVALALVCSASRLVFESRAFPYYLLAASVLFLLLDLVARRSPHLSSAGARQGVLRGLPARSRAWMPSGPCSSPSPWWPPACWMWRTPHRLPWLSGARRRPDRPPRLGSPGPAKRLARIEW